VTSSEATLQLSRKSNLVIDGMNAWSEQWSVKLSTTNDTSDQITYVPNPLNFVSVNCDDTCTC